MFTQHCFIRKNTPELRNKLKELGWRENTLDDFSSEWLAANYGMFISVMPGFEKYNPNDIDCGDNEELFLALVALRDDTDEHQWFIMDTDVYLDLDKGGWFIATNVHGKYHVGTKIDSAYCHKATTKEIIKHFQHGVK